MSFYKPAAAVTFALACVTGCETPVDPRPIAPSFDATSNKDVISVPFSVPYYLGCLDEEVTWSGTVVYREQVIIRPDGTTRYNGKAELMPGSTMVGPSSEWIDPRVRSQYHFDSTEQFGDNTAYINERITWTHASSGALMDVYTKVKLVIAGNGDAKLEIFDLWCSVR